MGKFSGLMIVVLVMISYSRIDGAVHTVGDSSGWSMGPDYSTWTTDKTFALGDTLVFKYGSGHTVDEVSEDDYKTCTTGNAIASDSSGATSITLNKPGPHYFICGVSGHCTAGMKVSVNVAASPGPSSAAASPAPSSTTVPAAGSSTTTTTTVSHTQPAASFSAALSPSTAACFLTLITINCFLLF